MRPFILLPFIFREMPSFASLYPRSVRFWWDFSEHCQTKCTDFCFRAPTSLSGPDVTVFWAFQLQHFPMQNAPEVSENNRKSLLRGGNPTKSTKNLETPNTIGRQSCIRSLQVARLFLVVWTLLEIIKIDGVCFELNWIEMFDLSKSANWHSKFNYRLFWQTCNFCSLTPDVSFCKKWTANKRQTNAALQVFWRKRQFLSKKTRNVRFWNKFSPETLNKHKTWLMNGKKMKGKWEKFKEQSLWIVCGEVLVWITLCKLYVE